MLASVCVLYWYTIVEVNIIAKNPFKSSHSDCYYVKLPEKGFDNKRTYLISLSRNNSYDLKKFIRENPKVERIYLYKIKYEDYTGYHLSRYSWLTIDEERKRRKRYEF